MGVLALVDATEPSGFSPSPRPSPAGRGGDAGSVCAGAAFTFSGGAQTTALAGTVTAMVGGWSFMSSRGMWTGAADSAMLGESLAERSGAAEAGGIAFAEPGFASAAIETTSDCLGTASAGLGTAADAAADAVSTAAEGKFSPAAAFPTAADAKIPAADASFAADDGLSAAAAGGPAASGTLGTASLPSAGLSALDLRHQSNMAGTGGVVPTQADRTPAANPLSPGGGEGEEGAAAARCAGNQIRLLTSAATEFTHESQSAAGAGAGRCLPSGPGGAGASQARRASRRGRGRGRRFSGWSV